MNQETDTENDKSRLFQILIWFLFVSELLGVCARLGTKFAMSRRLAWDDYLIMIAQVRRTQRPSTPDRMC